MRFRLRPERMSLATKSRWLFGIAAFVMITAAALITFQRAEQLTNYQNISAGQAVAKTEIARHVALAQGNQLPSNPQLQIQFDAMPQKLSAPRLVPIRELQQALPRSFPADALDRFTKRRDRENFTRLETIDDKVVFQYAEPLRNFGSCVECHSPPGTTLPVADVEAPALIFSATRPATAPTTKSTTQPVAKLVAPVGELLGAVVVHIPDQVPLQQIILNRVFLIGGALFSGLLAIVTLSFIITRLILRPVRVLQETAEKVSAGDLNVRSDIATGDEFQKLSETFNRMLRNLKNSRNALSSANKSLDLQIVKLSQVNVGLNEANRLKNEFLANVSHELRTPLNSILGFADLLRETLPKDDARSQRYLQNIAHSSGNLLDLINDLLDLAKIEAGRVEVRPGELSLSDLFEGLAGLLKPLLEKKQLVLQLQVSPDVPIVRTDAARFQQVLYNLLSNAIKFSPNGSQIDLIAVRQDDNHVRVAVKDRGPGIDPQHHETIFEKFRQLDQSVTRNFGGTGLGLSISRELMKLLGGSIGVDSELGKGATFWCVLPIGDVNESGSERSSS
ncbi:MAG: ATP-binding protein [Tepidisphaeraceae bacterium]